MMMDASLLDTDVLSEVLKQRHAGVTRHAAEYLQEHGEFAFSVVTRFEITRGYELRGSSGLLSRFNEFCGHSLIVPLTEETFDRAADLWVLGRKRGLPCGDADLLIAATAVEVGRCLVTGNVSHFSWIPGLQLTSWQGD